MNESDKRTYDLLKIEDIIWFIYLFIVIANLYSNYMQEKNVEIKDMYDKKAIRSLNLVVLIVVFIIYVYFVIKNYNDVIYAYKNNKPYKAYLNKLGTFASILFVIAGLIFIYLEYHSLDEEEIGII